MAQEKRDVLVQFVFSTDLPDHQVDEFAAELEKEFKVFGEYIAGHHLTGKETFEYVGSHTLSRLRPEDRQQLLELFSKAVSDARSGPDAG